MWPGCDLDVFRVGVVHVPHTNHVGEELRDREERGPLTWRGLCSPLSTAHRRRGQMLCMHKAGCTVDFNVECKNPVDVTVDVTVDVKKRGHSDSRR